MPLKSQFNRKCCQLSSSHLFPMRDKFMGSNSYLLSQETDTYDIVHIMLNLIGFDNFHVSFMFHVSIGFDNSNAYLCNRPATDTVVSYSNDNFFIQMNASCLSLSFHQKRGAIERGWVQNRPFSFE